MANDQKSGKGKKTGPLASGIIVLIASIFLLVYDKNLVKYGMYHWDALIVYVIIVAIFLGVGAKSPRAGFAVLTAVSVIFIILILLDAALNLPISQFYQSNNGMFGWRYLFGFGYAGDSSTFARSLAIVIDLIFSGILAGTSARAMRKTTAS